MGATLFLLFCCTLLELATCQTPTLQEAIARLDRSGIVLATSSNQVDLQLNSIESNGIDLPLAYRTVRDSMIEEARKCTQNEKFRRADGLCNNLGYPLRGSSLSLETRLLPNAYDDGTGIPRLHSFPKFEKVPLPSARTVSVECFPPNQEHPSFLDKKTTQMSMQWAQYIDHDLVFTEEMEGHECCKYVYSYPHRDVYFGLPCFPIHIPANDRHFTTTCMPFSRSFGVFRNGRREQVNGITSFLDASSVYGSHQTLQDALRSHKDGKMKVDTSHLSRGNLPTNETFDCRKDRLNPKVGCLMAGDRRVNVFQGLTLLHLMWVREHNRIAEGLKQNNSHWGDERLFQETRKIIAALHQKITYEDWLPGIVGPEAIELFNLKFGSYKYDGNIDPTIMNEFAGAALRFGHSQINSVLRINNKITPISEIFLDPSAATSSSAQIKMTMKDQCVKNAQKVNRFITREVTDKLFLNVDGPGLSTDLAARNVQRARDHGIGPYVDYLDFAMKTFAKNLKNPPTLKLPECFTRNVYRSARDIDLFAGAMDENHIPGAIVGPTFATILSEQFRRLKFGDSFFYETKDAVKGFTAAQLNEIRSTTLAMLICRNTDVISVQRDVFQLENPGNQPINCADYPDINLSLWKEY